MEGSIFRETVCIKRLRMLIRKGAVLKFEELARPYTAVCDNCLNTYIVYQTEEGVITFQCPVCGTKIRIRRESKTYVIKELRFPR